MITIFRCGVSADIVRSMRRDNRDVARHDVIEVARHYFR